MLQLKRLTFLLYYYYKKYLIRNRSANDIFWNWYYRLLTRHHGLRMLDQNEEEILVKFQRPGFLSLMCYLRIGSSDPIPYDQVFIQSEYYPLLSLIEKNKDMGDIRYIMDAGGNIGLTTLYLKQYFPAAKILIIEPDERNYYQIQKNISVNKLAGVNPVKAGIWSHDAYLSINHPEGLMNQTALMVAESSTPTGLKGVSVNSVADSNSFPEIDILKMDIEGTEEILFNDPVFRQTLIKRVRYLALEIHDRAKNAPLIHRFFTENGFAFNEISETTFAVNTKLAGK